MGGSNIKTFPRNLLYIPNKEIYVLLVRHSIQNVFYGNVIA